ncbi:MAG: metallophosphoesterase [Lentisphaeria bacterium]
MTIFVLTYFGVVGLLSAYVLCHLRRAVGPGWRFRTAAAAVAALVVLMPALQRFGAGLPFPLLRVGAHLADGWLFLLFWLFFLHLGFDLAWLATRPLAGLIPAWRGRWLPAAVQAGLCWLLAVTALLCGLAQGRLLAVREVEVLSDRLSFDAPPLRLALVADLHLGLTSLPGRAEEVARRLAELQPDLILCAGDFVDATEPPVREMVAPFARLNPPLGKFAVVGNHEVYPGLDQTLELLRLAGFTALRNRVEPVGDAWQVVGVDDPQADLLAASPVSAETLLLPERRGFRYVILLKHRPEVSAAARERADLQLSGHTHGGQVFPFDRCLRPFFPYLEGRLHALPEGLRLYVSPGTGSWGLPVRFGTTAEITLVTIRPLPLAAAPP